MPQFGSKPAEERLNGEDSNQRNVTRRILEDRGEDCLYGDVDASVRCAVVNAAA